MSDLIKTHYKDEDIQKLNLCTDVEKWNSEVEFVDVENNFYRKVFSSSLIERTNLTYYDICFINQELETLTVKTEEFKEKLRGFLIELEGINECDDILCENYFLNYHQIFKMEIENYFYLNRRIKTLMYSFLSEGLKKII